MVFSGKAFFSDVTVTSQLCRCSSISCFNLEDFKQSNANTTDSEKSRKQRFYSTSAPASTNSLLGNFEVHYIKLDFQFNATKLSFTFCSCFTRRSFMFQESLLNGRIEPCGVVDGFKVELGASGSFCPRHVTLPVTAYFFKLSEDNAPSPYLVRTTDA